jgi:predicted transcriptional regulator
MQTITVRLPDDLFQALKEHKQHTDVPTEAFVRRAIRAALSNKIVDDVESEPARLPAPIAAKIQELKSAHISEPKSVSEPESKAAPVTASKGEIATAARLRMNSYKPRVTLIDVNNPSRFPDEKEGE